MKTSITVPGDVTQETRKRVKYARKAGGRWRLGASKLTERGTMFPGGMYGDPVHVDAEDYGPNEFDELVVGNWIHLEQMDHGHWWMNVGGVTVLIDADRDGNAKHVQVFGPDDYAWPVDGCSYTLVWSDRTLGTS